MQIFVGQIFVGQTPGQLRAGVRMALFERADRTAKRLAAGPTLVLAADPADAIAEALLGYDPELRVRSDRFDFGNGVRLHGPVGLTPALAGQAGLPGGMTAAYYADIVETGSRGLRPDSAKRQDAERLVRGLAVRLGGTVHNPRPPLELNLSASVYCAEPVPAEQVISVLQPYTDDRLFVDDYPEVPGSYFLVSEAEPRFLTVYWPPRLARSALQPAPLALGSLRRAEPCRWELRSKYQAASADREIRLVVGEAALALSRSVTGAVIDAYGFPVGRPEDLLTPG